MKAVLISIKPRWAGMIERGEKTIEVRKTRPKIETPFKCYIYCTNGGGWLTAVNGTVQPLNELKIDLKVKENKVAELNGYVIGEFVCDTFITDKSCGHDALFNGAACLKEDEAANYAKGKPLYGWHISDLKIYDEPKKLGEYERACDHENDCCTCKRFGVNYACINSISRPPQSFMYVEEL